MVKDGENLNQTFHRGVVIPGEQITIDSGKFARPGGIPPRPESLLPPPGDMHLEISLGKELGSGRAGSVRAVNVFSPKIGTGLPKLVLKIAHRKRSVNLAQEAWFYEELEQLQGIAVPRCYGFFQAQLEDGYKVSTWSPYDDDLDTKKKNKGKGPPGGERLLSILVLEKLGSRMPVGKPIDSVM